MTIFGNIYMYPQTHCEDNRINGKLLNAYIDLELTYLFMMRDVHLAGGTHNQLHSAGKTESGSVRQDFELFSGKMKILNALSACLLEFVHFGINTLGSYFCYMNDQNLINLSE